MANERPMSGHLSDLARYAQQDIMSVEPPLLEQYRDAPVHDQTVILQLVAVRPLALWSLEQHIGIASGARGTSELNGQKRRYSERDLVALMWLRERVIEGEAPQEAGARLIAAQRQRNSGSLNSGGLSSGPLSGAGRSGSLGGGHRASGRNSGPIEMTGQDAPYPNLPPQPRYPLTSSGQLASTESPTGSFQPLRDYPDGASGGFGAPVYPPNGPYTPGADRGDYPTGSWNSGRQPSGSWNSGALPYASGPRPPNTSRPLNANASRPLNQYGAGYGADAPRAAAPSGRLGSVYGAPIPITRPPNGFDAARDQTAARELRGLVAPLMQAFARFDTTIANRLIQQSLERFSVEVVCLGLVQPAIIRVGDLWSRNEMTA
ncbi:MAG TPA: B12-binding domain-containing protein, partial [Ktedonobacterales bacterium]